MTLSTEAEKRAMKKYRESEKGKAAQRKYSQSPKGKKAVADCQVKFLNSLKGKAARLHSNKKSYCKCNGIEYTLDKQWYTDRLTAGRCEITDVKFDLPKYCPGSGQKGPTPKSPSVDRIDPGGPYSPENCRMILFSVNAFKQQMTDGQLERMALKLAKALKQNRESGNMRPGRDETS